MPPPAEGLSTRLFLGPALRAQSDGRLARLVHEGYESAFEEIVRRYDKALGRYAAAIVGGRAEDVTQDAFSKALLALRRQEAEIELRPWLYRIVRNTALNDLRDRPPTLDELSEETVGGRSVAEEAERREEVTELMTRLRALPEPQRAAIVMRELEGLSHEEIAAALGVTGGAARQFIYRARMALRDGVGMLIPLPLLRLLIDHGAETATAGAGAGAATMAAGATLGGAGAGGAALKLGVATALIAGSVGAGVAIHDRTDGGRSISAAAATSQSSDVDTGASGARPAHRPAVAAIALGGRQPSGEGRESTGAGDDRRGRTSEGPGPGEGNFDGEGRPHRHSGHGFAPHEPSDGGGRGPRPGDAGGRSGPGPRDGSGGDGSGPPREPGGHDGSGGDGSGNGGLHDGSGRSGPPPPPPLRQGSSGSGDGSSSTDGD